MIFFYKSILITSVVLFNSSAYSQKLSASKATYGKKDTVVFNYSYPATHTWESLWLVVKPTGSRGDNLTTAADLYGNPAVRKFANRFSPGKYKASLISNSENGRTVKELVSCYFEVRE